jgi:hypothetical protein
VNRWPSSGNREAVDDDVLIARLAGSEETALRELFFRHAPM